MSTHSRIPVNGVILHQSGDIVYICIPEYLHFAVNSEDVEFPHQGGLIVRVVREGARLVGDVKSCDCGREHITIHRSVIDEAKNQKK